MNGPQGCRIVTHSQQLQTQLAACAGSEAEAWQKLYCRVISHVEWSQATCKCCLRYVLLGDAPAGIIAGILSLLHKVISLPISMFWRSQTRPLDCLVGPEVRQTSLKGKLI